MSMVPPVLKCLAKEQREKDGYKTFKAWIEDPKNVYIGPNIHKYVQNYKGKESMWMNPYQAHFTTGCLRMNATKVFSSNFS